MAACICVTNIFVRALECLEMTAVAVLWSVSGHRDICILHGSGIASSLTVDYRELFGSLGL